jgi:hypothetical protein
MTEHDAGEGEVGDTWLQLWSVARIDSTAVEEPARYEGVFCSLAMGASTVYGCDAIGSGEIVGGNWISVGRSELISHGRSFVTFLENLQSPT